MCGSSLIARVRACACGAGLLCCALPLPGADVPVLLAGYLQNDVDIQNCAAQVERQELSRTATAVSNGFSITLSTGTVTVVTGSDFLMTFTPQASATFPQYRSLSFVVSSDFALASSGMQVEDTSLALTLDLLSGSKETRELALLAAERNVLVARRALQDAVVGAEKEFYTELKALYQAAADIVEAKDDLYTDQLALDQIRAQGYSPSSSKYRTAQMKVVSDTRTVETEERALERDAKIFASRCGVEYDAPTALEFLPAALPEVQAVDVLSFDKQAYTELESATWTQRYNALARAADKALTLTGRAGYTFNNATTGTDTVDTGASLTWHDTGLAASAGVSLPVAANPAPVLTMALSFDPAAFVLADIAQKQDAIDERQEALSLASAEEAYRTAVVSCQTELEDIQWNRRANGETYELYRQLEADTAGYFARGIITESEYRSAQVNKEKYRLLCVVNDIELIIYNDGTRLLFCRDSEGEE